MQGQIITEHWAKDPERVRDLELGLEIGDLVQYLCGRTKRTSLLRNARCIR